MPAVQRARRGLRRRRPVEPRRPRRRRVDRQRSEGLDDARPPLAVGHARRPHRPRASEAQGPHRTSSSTCTRPASRCGRCARSPARPSSTRCTSPTSASPTPSGSATSATGWRVSLTTLMNERVSIGGAIAAARARAAIAEAVKVWQDAPADRRDPAMQGRADEALDRGRGATGSRTSRAGSNRKIGTPGPEGSIGKLAFAELNKRIYEFAMDLMGADGMLYGELHDATGPSTRWSPARLQKAFLRVAGQLDRGRHVRGHAQHPRRAGARPARRRAGRQGRLLELRCRATSSSRQAAQVAECRPRRPERGALRGSLDLRAVRSGTRRLGPSATPRPSRARGAGTRARALDQHPDSARSRPRARGPGRTRRGHGNMSRGR